MELISVNISTKEVVIRADDGSLQLYDILFPEHLDPLDVEATVTDIFRTYGDIASIERVLNSQGLGISLNKNYGT